MTQDEFDSLTAQTEATITAKVLCDSVAPNGCRLTTMEWTYPRAVHSEILTHRQLSRNSASSRAIPLAKMIERIESCPFFPLHWGKNQRGMQAEQELNQNQKLAAADAWLAARDCALICARNLEKVGIHKQIGNRLLEPWMFITVIASATNWENLFALRCHPDAEPHFQNIAYKARNAYDASTPTKLAWGQWHLPLFGFEGDDAIPEEDRPKVSAGRAARVSYLTHDGRRDPAEDIKLYERLATAKPPHASPLEHVAKAEKYGYGSGYLSNFGFGWVQFRKMHAGECVTSRCSTATGSH